MNISGKNYYFGAYLEKYGLDPSHVYYSTQEGLDKSSENVWKIQNPEMADREWRIDTSFDSCESRKDSIVVGDSLGMNYSDYFSGRDLLEKKYGADDVFRIYGNQQWLVFSEQLYQTGFYENLSDDEMLQVDQMLSKITAVLDGFHSYEMDNSMIADYLEIYNKPVAELIFSDYEKIDFSQWYYAGKEEWEAQLESATGALRYFNRNFVEESHQAEFDKLIDRFYEHNSSLLKDYVPPTERLAIDYQKYLDEQKPDRDKMIEKAAKGEDISVVHISETGKGSGYIDDIKTYFRMLSASSGTGSGDLLKQFEHVLGKDNGNEGWRDMVQDMKRGWERLVEGKLH